MKKRLAALAGALLLTTGCIDSIHMWGGGWYQDPSPSNPIKLQSNPFVSFGWPLQQAADKWNATAGTTIFAMDTTGVPDVEFRPMTPICARNDCAHRVHMWVDVESYRVNSYITHCVVYYDPTWHWLDQYWWAPDIIAHEIGHCLDYPDMTGQGYIGAMSYDNFYNPSYRATHWWRQDDHDMLTRDGYGP